MSETKFTPGPWKVTTCMDYWIEHDHPITSDDEDFRGIAEVGSIEWPNFENKQLEWEANARLIAAAPELYEALQRCLVYIERDELAHGRQFGEGNEARSALAKASGASP